MLASLYESLEPVITLFVYALCFSVSDCLLSACLHMLLDADVRLARRIRRDTVERGRDIDSVLEQVRPHS